MQLAPLDITIIVVFISTTLLLGFYASRSASKNIKSYFLGGNSLPWPALSLSNASGTFDIAGTMWMVYLMYVYGLKSVWIPWLWPVFNQIFDMVFLSIWLRRSKVLTGAEWINFRFGSGFAVELSKAIVIIFALLNVIGFLAYGFVGIGKFATIFLPWELHADPKTNETLYGLILVSLTTIYVIKGGMFSVVFTEVMQFAVMTIASIAVGIIAMQQVSPDLLKSVTPEGWDDIWFGWDLGLDWSGILDSANSKIDQDGWTVFGMFMLLVLFKGVLVSLAGAVPNYSMQRQLATRSPTDAAKMNGFISLVVLFPRYMLVTGLTVLALAFFTPELQAMGDDVDFEKILPFAMNNFLPAGLLGLLIAGLLAAFMSTFAATTNAAPVYLVNDVYKRYINPNASDKTYVRMSYLCSLLFVIIGTGIGIFIPSLNIAILWLVSALFGGYAAANIFRWYWWRFNAYGYFWGMLAGVLAAIPLAFTDFSPLRAFPLTFAICILGCVVGTYSSPKTDMEVLKNFYIKTRPWGLWGEVHKAVEDDGYILEKNHAAPRDLFNVFIGLCWQTALTAAPVFLVIQNFMHFSIAIGVVIVCSIVLKFTWYNYLQDYPPAPALAASDK